jgi:excisionase family DNA binding protein
VPTRPAAITSARLTASPQLVRLNDGMPVGGSNKLIGCRELAERLSVPERTVRDNWRKWGLTAYKVGRAIRLRERDVEVWLQRSQIK